MIQQSIKLVPFLSVSHLSPLPHLGFRRRRPVEHTAAATLAAPSLPYLSLFSVTAPLRSRPRHHRLPLMTSSNLSSPRISLSPPFLHLIAFFPSLCRCCLPVASLLIGAGVIAVQPRIISISANLFLIALFSQILDINFSLLQSNLEICLSLFLTAKISCLFFFYTMKPQFPLPRSHVQNWHHRRLSRLADPSLPSP